MRKRVFLSVVVLIAVGIGIYVWRDQTSAASTPSAGPSSAELLREEKLGSTSDAGKDSAHRSQPQEKRKSTYFMTDGTSFASVRLAAEQGDAAAQRLLAEIYTDCFGYIVMGQNHVDNHLDWMASRQPGAKSRIQTMKQSIADFCSTVIVDEDENGRRNPMKAVDKWEKLSEEGGDLLAEIRTPHRSQKSRQTDSQEYLERVLEEKNPEALFYLADSEHPELYLDKPQTSDPMKDPATMGFAMQIAACRLGMDCGPDSRLLRNMCYSGFGCNYRNYEEFLMTRQIPVNRRGQVAQMAIRIQLIWQNWDRFH